MEKLQAGRKKPDTEIANRISHTTRLPPTHTHKRRCPIPTQDYYNWQSEYWIQPTDLFFYYYYFHLEICRHGTHGPSATDSIIPYSLTPASPQWAGHRISWISYSSSVTWFRIDTLVCLLVTRGVLSERRHCLGNSTQPHYSRNTRAFTYHRQTEMTEELFKHLSLPKNHGGTLQKCRFLGALILQILMQ